MVMVAVKMAYRLLVIDSAAAPLSLSAAGTFKSIGQAEHPCFVEMPGQNLHSDRKSFGRLSAGHTHARNARQIAGDGVNVGEIHGQRIVYLFADLKRRERRNRRHDS